MTQFDSVQSAVTAIKAHPMCASFVDLPIGFLVMYPDGCKGTDGYMARKDGNDLRTLTELYGTIERAGVLCGIVAA